MYYVRNYVYILSKCVKLFPPNKHTYMYPLPQMHTHVKYSQTYLFFSPPKLCCRIWFAWVPSDWHASWYTLSHCWTLRKKGRQREAKYLHECSSAFYLHIYVHVHTWLFWSSMLSYAFLPLLARKRKLSYSRSNQLLNAMMIISITSAVCPGFLHVIPTHEFGEAWCNKEQACYVSMNAH